MSKNWYEQDNGVKVSGNYLDHVTRGFTVTNAERFGINPLTERTDFLIDNPLSSKGHEHFSVDAYGNITNWHQ